MGGGAAEQRTKCPARHDNIKHAPLPTARPRLRRARRRWRPRRFHDLRAPRGKRLEGHAAGEGTPSPLSHRRVVAAAQPSHPATPGCARSGRGDRHEKARRRLQLEPGSLGPPPFRLFVRAGQKPSLRVRSSPLGIRQPAAAQQRRQGHAGAGRSPGHGCRVSPGRAPGRARGRRAGQYAELDLPLLHRRLRPRHVAGQALQPQAEEPAPRQRGDLWAFHECRAARRRVRRQHQRLLVRARLVLDDPAQGRQHERRRRLPSRIPEAAPEQSRRIPAADHRHRPPRDAAPDAQCATGQQRGARHRPAR